MIELIVAERKRILVNALMDSSSEYQIKPGETYLFKITVKTRIDRTIWNVGFNNKSHSLSIDDPQIERRKLIAII